jgi:hypothetical protein
MVYLTSLGWLTALPIAVSILLGRFLDNRYGTGSFWTLALLGAGVVIAGLEVYLAMRRALGNRNHD